MVSDFEKICTTFNELQIPYHCEFNGTEVSVDTPFCSYRFQAGTFVEILKRDIDCVGRAGAYLGWRESSPVSLVPGVGLDAGLE